MPHKLSGNTSRTVKTSDESFKLAQQHSEYEAQLEQLSQAFPT